LVPEFEHQNGLNDRRSFMKLLAAAPLFATIGTRSVAAAVSNAVASTVKRSYTDNIYTRIGVKPLINARGTWTYLCGSLGVRTKLPPSSKASEFRGLFRPESTSMRMTVPHPAFRHKCMRQEAIPH
jgi:L-seryl-tRNA(Ser) seleniumtransferase